MIVYVFRKLLLTLGVLLFVSLITFILTFIVPSDPARALLGIQADESSVLALQKELKLDQPFTVQYWDFLKKLTKGDLGRSYVTNREVKDLIAERFVATAKLALFAIAIASVIGIVIGCLSVYTGNRFIYRILTSCSILFASIPVFFLSLIISLFIGWYLRLLPMSGYEAGRKGIKYLILPGISLSIYPMALIARLTATKLLEIMDSDYIRTHFAMGFRRWRVILIFAFKNSIVPLLSVIGNSVAILLSGAFFVEYIFSWPGIGLLWVDSILRYDFPVIIGIVMFSAAIFVIISMALDLIYPVFDPRIR